MSSHYPNPPINVCPKLITLKEDPDPDGMECVFCWQSKSDYPRQEVKLLNSKYCTLYSNCKEPVKQIIPNFEHCETLYTKCDYLIEKDVHSYIIKLEDLFKDYQKLFLKEKEKQLKLVNEMWVHSQRFLILTQSGVCVKPYPEIVSVPTERRALCSFHSNLRKVNASNCRLTTAVENMETTLTELHRQCQDLDVTVRSPFMLGTYYLKRLADILEIIHDLFHYFYCNLCKQKRWAQLLDPGDAISIEDYMNLLKSSKENDLLENLKDCKCLRSHRKQCIKPHKIC